MFAHHLFLVHSLFSLQTIAITLGDVAGIGPEIVRKALRSGKLDRHFHYEILLADCAPKVTLGKLSKKAARFALESLEVGVAGCLQDHYVALVTAPVSKIGLKQVGFRFSGQTEWLAYRTKTKKFAMFLIGGNLRVALVTTHIPLRKVSLLLTRKSVRDTIELTYRWLLNFGIRRPRILVAGLNPHAGVASEEGREEIEIIRPAVREAQRRLTWIFHNSMSRGTACRAPTRYDEKCSLGKEITGPHSPDVVFWKAYHGEADAVVCMYHDQGLIPLKMLAFDCGVNLTLGLPIIRTSPDHGTAYDIVGKNKANPQSMIEAINLATQLSVRRRLVTSR